MPQATIAALAEGSWISDRESIILSGESGSGKTQLAIALAICACQQGRRVRFTTLAALANELQEAESRRELQRVVSRYARVELLVLDEVGYLALPEGAAELVFQVISERNERASLIATTNLPFGEWTKGPLAGTNASSLAPPPTNCPQAEQETSQFQQKTTGSPRRPASTISSFCCGSYRLPRVPGGGCPPTSVWAEPSGEAPVG